MTQELVTYRANNDEGKVTITLQQQDGSSLAVFLPTTISPDDQFIIEQWLAVSSSPATQKAYTRDITRFYQFQLARGLTSIRAMHLADIRAYADHLIAHTDLKISSRARTLASVRSLFSFASKLQYLPVNTAQLLTLPKVPDDLASRILPEENFHRMIEQEPKLRDRTIFMLLYYCALRRVEVCRLLWKHILPRMDDAHFGATLTVHGKGSKTRHVAVKHLVYNSLMRLKEQMREEGYPTGGEDYIFQAKPTQRTQVPTGTQQMHENTVHEMVKRIARRVGIDAPVSAHWFRHGYATYAQSHGASALQVMRDMGHGTLATTTKYSHLVDSDGAGRFL